MPLRLQLTFKLCPEAPYTCPRKVSLQESSDCPEILSPSSRLHMMNCTSDFDDIIMCLEELEKQENLSLNLVAHIRTLKLELRFVRIFVNWGTAFAFKRLLSGAESLLQDVNTELVQPTRKGTMTADNLDETILSLLRNEYLTLLKAEIRTTCIGFFDGDPEIKIIYKDVVIDELVMEWFDPLLEILNFFLSYTNVDMLASLKEQITALEEKLRFLRNFLQFTGTEIEKMTKFKANEDLQKRSEDLLTQIKVLTENAIYLSFVSWVEDGESEITLKSMLFDLLLKIRHIEPQITMICVLLSKVSKAAKPGDLGINLQALVSVDSLLDNLEALPHLESGSVICMDDHQIEMLSEELRFLRYFLMDPDLKQYTETESERFNSLLRQVEAMARDGASSVHSLCFRQDVIKEKHPLLYDILKYIHLLKAHIKQIYLRVPKPSASKFPSNPKLVFIDSLLHNLDELINYRIGSIACVKNKLEVLQCDLVFLRSFFSDLLKQSKKTEEHEDIEERIMYVAHEAECATDSIAASNGPLWYNTLWLSDITEKMEHLRAEVTKVRDEIITVLHVEKVYDNESLLANTSQIYEEVVGFEDQAEMLIEQLTRRSKQQDIVSIVGMPGLGKTTLAKKLYDGPVITSYFHVRSWCCVSRIYEIKQLLLDILANIIELTTRIYRMSVDDLAEMLYKSLKGKRYLIVMDDVWDEGAWNGIRMSLPDDHNGSRIMFTSRLRNVALEVRPGIAPHVLRLFSEEESWELLQKKVFQQQRCPPELSIVGKRIAENCKGLPLAVVVIAGVLTKLDKSQDQWEQVAENMGKHVVDDLSKCMDVFELSYKHLPNPLKPCFLYFGAFPEDREIPVSKLIRLWIAEGFVQKSEAESLESVVAEGYLMDLIGRSLVTTAKRKCRGGVKACHIHDLLHEFCLTKAKEENFLLQLHGSEKNSPFSDGLKFNVDSICTHPAYHEQHRLCFISKRRDFYWWRPSAPYIRSVLFFPTDHYRYSKYFSLYSRSFSYLCYSLKLLRVLDLGQFNTGKSFPTEIELLVCLRYLAVRGEMNSIPSSVENLRWLQTFHVKGLKGEVKLPASLWKLPMLKHICVDDWAAFELPIYGPQYTFILGDIETLSTPSLRYGDGTVENIIRRLSGLRKLKCIFLESWDYSRCCNRFPVLDFISKLESLKVLYYGRVQHPCEFHFPSNLKKLTLSKFCLPWSAMSTIGKLPNLEALKLLFKAFEGQTWDVSAEEFPNLKFLKLDSLNIAHLNASEDAFPQLQRLVLQRCKELQEISSSLGEISTLEMIEVQWCSRSAAAAVRQIQEEQGLGDEGLKVIIQPPDWDSTSAC